MNAQNSTVCSPPRELEVSVAEAVDAGRAAWQRIRDHGRMAWDDWLAVGRALVIGRAETMAKANSNRPLGSRYNRLMGAWLKQHGLDGIDNQQRYRAIQCIENLQAIDAWRAALDDRKKRSLNHPGACWHAWKRSTKEAAPAAKQPVKTAMPSHKHGRPIYWPEHCLRRAHEAMLKSRSSDLLVLARCALEAAIPSEHVLIELLDAAQPQPARAAAAHAAA
jgi:hypothetical protein